MAPAKTQAACQPRKVSGPQWVSGDFSSLAFSQ